MSETSKPIKKTSAKKTATKKTVSKKTTSRKTVSKKAVKTQDSTLTITQPEKEENIVLNQPIQEETTTEPKVNEDTIVSEKMGFFKLYFSTWKKMFSIKDRANRTEIFLFPIVNLFIFFSFWLASLAVDFFFEAQLMSLILIIIPYILAITSFPASIALLIRRFHDFEKRATFAVLPYLLFLILSPLILFVLNQIDAKPTLISLGLSVTIILWLWALIWTLMYMFRPGTKGSNKYGEKPQTKTRIIWINLLIVLLNVVLYYGVLIFSFLLTYIEMPSNLQTINQNVYESMPYSNSISNVEPGATAPLSDEEFEAEILKMEKFINSLPDENNLINIETTEPESPVTTKNLLAPKE